MEAGHGKTFRARVFAAARFAVAPVRTGAGIEQHAGDGQLKLHAQLLARIGRGAWRKLRPAINAADAKVAPAAVVRNGQRRIGGAHGVEHEICRVLELVQVQAKVRQRVVAAGFEQQPAAPANSGGVEQGGGEFACRGIVFGGIVLMVAMVLFVLRCCAHVSSSFIGSVIPGVSSGWKVGGRGICLRIYKKQIPRLARDGGVGLLVQLAAFGEL